VPGIDSCRVSFKWEALIALGLGNEPIRKY
jgi:hypothetical protein